MELTIELGQSFDIVEELYILLLAHNFQTII